MAFQFASFVIVTTIQWEAITSVEYSDHIVTPQDENFVLNGATNDAVISQDQLTGLLMQSDGNLVLYIRPDTTSPLSAGTVAWHTVTYNVAINGWASLQWDGNFVVYDTSWQSRWGSGSWHGGGKSPNILIVDNGGYAYIVNRKNEVIWQINNANTITPSLHQSSLDPKCTFQVLSIYHVHTNNGKYFHFDANTVDIMLGRTDWDSSNFTIYNPRTSQFSKVIFWRANNNGGSIGTAHGRKQPMDAALDGDWQLNDMLTLIGLPHQCYTLSPTKSPTSNTGAPTSNTPSPTSNTVSPTSNTVSPTSNTAAPTVYTNSPSASTVSPSSMPTNLPTVSPTQITSPPTDSPTKQPSKQPSVTPTNAPTKSPTFNPSDQPTHAPVKDGQAIDGPETNTLYTTIGAGANIGDTEQKSNEKLLIVIVLSILFVLMGIGCIFIFICWKCHKKNNNLDDTTEVEINVLDRVMSVSSGVETNINGFQINTMASSGEGFDVDETGNLPPEPTDIDGDNTDTNKQSELFLQNVDDDMNQNNTAGFEDGTPGGQIAVAYTNDIPTRDTDSDSADDDRGMYEKPVHVANNVTQGMED